MTDPDAADRRFAANLFARSDDDDQVLDDDKRDQRTDDGLDEQRRFAAHLFAPADEDAPLLAGLTTGRTVGQWPRPQRDDVPHNAFKYS